MQEKNKIMKNCLIKITETALKIKNPHMKNALMTAKVDLGEAKPNTTHKSTSLNLHSKRLIQAPPV
jgi:hypothetical protein